MNAKVLGVIAALTLLSIQTANASVLFQIERISERWAF
jgi:hypothetical protein